MKELSKRDIIAISASAGGLEALKNLVAGLPADLPAALFVVVHTPPWHKSELPTIINCNGHLVALHPRSDELIQHGHIYVAPPDHHLLVEDDHIDLWRGPKENRFRPAINALFRSVAVCCKERVIGVVLSGSLDDGAAGLWWIKHFGGTAVVQDPEEARNGDMPRSAMEHVHVDYVVRSTEMGSLLAELVTGDGTSSELSTSKEPSDGE